MFSLVIANALRPTEQRTSKVWFAFIIHAGKNFLFRLSSITDVIKRKRFPLENVFRLGGKHAYNNNWTAVRNENKSSFVWRFSDFSLSLRRSLQIIKGLQISEHFRSKTTFSSDRATTTTAWIQTKIFFLPWYLRPPIMFWILIVISLRKFLIILISTK